MKKLFSLFCLFFFVSTQASFAVTVSEWAGQAASGMSEWMGQTLPAGGAAILEIPGTQQLISY